MSIQPRIVLMTVLVAATVACDTRTSADSIQASGESEMTEAMAPETSDSRPAADQRPAITGRWKKLVRPGRRGPTLIFHEDGTLRGIYTPSNQVTGSYAIEGPGQLSIDLDGDELMATYTISGDTLVMHAAGTPQPDVYLRIR